MVAEGRLWGMSTDWKLDATEAGVSAESIADIVVMLLGHYGLRELR